MVPSFSPKRRKKPSFVVTKSHLDLMSSLESMTHCLYSSDCGYPSTDEILVIVSLSSFKDSSVLGKLNRYFPSYGENKGTKFSASNNYTDQPL